MNVEESIQRIQKSIGKQAATTVCKDDHEKQQRSTEAYHSPFEAKDISITECKETLHTEVTFL